MSIVPISKALPERASAVINHRINVASSVGELQARIVKVLTPKAKELNLTLVAFGEEPSSLYPSTGRLVLEDAFGNWWVSHELLLVSQAQAEK